MSADHEAVPAVGSARLLQLRFKHLRLIEAIFETGSLRQAAARIHITQPAATLLLQEVEAALGLPLFHRHRRGVLPTAQAIQLRPRLKRALHGLVAIQQDAESLRATGRSVVRLGCLPRSMQTLMPKVLQKYCEQWPDVQVVLSEGTTDVLLHALGEGSLDCVVGRLTAESEPERQGHAFDNEYLYEDGLCFVCAPSHALARKRKITLKELAAQRWVLPPQGSVSRGAFVDEFVNAGLQPPPATIESAAFLSNLHLAAEGQLLAISPHSAARVHARRGEVKILPIELATRLPPISLIWRAGEVMDGPHEGLRMLLTQAAGRL